VATVERARWLAELAQALEQAQDLISEVGKVRERRGAALDLSARIEAACAEVRSLRLRMSETPDKSHPDWSKNLPWNRSASKGDV